MANSHGEDVDIFEKLMKAVGTRGRFQTRFNLTFNLAFVLMAAMPFLNLVLAMAVPEHWCHVPGRQHTNLSVDEWKNLTLPQEENNMEILAFSKCKMHAFVNISFADWTTQLNMSSKEIVECQHGWDYDKTWYEQTAPSQENWVCENQLKVTNTFVFGQVGLVVGTFLFGQLGDMLGRRPVFFLAIITTALGRCLLTVLSSTFPLFLTVAILGSGAESALFQSPLAISMEISDSTKRAHIAMLQCLGWTVGMCLMPMIAWATRDWKIFIFITSLPFTIFLFFHRFFVESPRWLAARGRAADSLRILQRIAEENGTCLPPNAAEMLDTMAKRKETVYGIASLLTSWRLVRNTLFLACCRMIAVLTYYTMVLNVSNMSGNPFLNFMCQSLVELPGFVLGRFLGDHMGRRWTQAVVMFVIAIANFLIVGVVTLSDLNWLTVGTVIFIRFLTTIVNYIGYLQGMEMYPTCIRQTGSSVAHVAASALSITGPYVVYLGTSLDVRYPYAIMGTLTVLGAMLASLLPETLHHRLPETLTEAQTFGCDQSYWSWTGRKSSGHSYSIPMQRNT